QRTNRFASWAPLILDRGQAAATDRSNVEYKLRRPVRQLKASRPAGGLTVQPAGLQLVFPQGPEAMDEAIKKAAVLIEALAYIRRFRGRKSVIKLGGSAMEDGQALQATLQDIVFMETVGLQPVLVHGGGKPIDRAMAAAGLEPRKIRGQRYTDSQALDIVVRVLTEDVNAE